MTASDLARSPGRALRRAAVLALVLFALLAVVAPAAFATEEAPAEGAAEEEKLTYDELQQNASQRAQEFFPDAYTEPSFFQWLSLPVLLGGMLIAGVLLGAYLWWQPKFASERRQAQRR